MDRVIELTNHFQIPAFLCINKYDLNVGMTETIEAYAQDKGVPVMERIPFDSLFTKAMVEKQTIIEYDGSSQAAQAVKEIWERLKSRL